MSQLSNESIRPHLYDVLGEDQHRYFVGIIEEAALRKFLVPIPPVRVGQTGVLIVQDDQVKLQQNLKQKILEELTQRIANGMIPLAESGGWFDSPIEAVEACLYQPITSCIPAEID